mmetsp:Transcript_55393/g.61804  ORF Transcript_55393/g.61804 Transcript_55393/m.61804 type:complete len:94 (+) Transcript_55393:66-347(+)
MNTHLDQQLLKDLQEIFYIHNHGRHSRNYRLNYFTWSREKRSGRKIRSIKCCCCSLAAMSASNRIRQPTRITDEPLLTLASTDLPLCRWLLQL